jgi:hypothetical protein
MMAIAVPAVSIPFFLVANVDDGIVHLETWVGDERRSGGRNDRAETYERGCTNCRN